MTYPLAPGIGFVWFWAEALCAARIERRAAVILKWIAGHAQ